MEGYREKDFLTVAEVAEALRVGKSKCYEIVKGRDCPFCVVKLGRTVRIPSNNFYKWYDSLMENGKGKRGQ